MEINKEAQTSGAVMITGGAFLSGVGSQEPLALIEMPKVQTFDKYATIYATNIGCRDTTYVIAAATVLAGNILSPILIKAGNMLTLSGSETTCNATIDGAKNSVGGLQITGTATLKAPVGGSNELFEINVANGAELTTHHATNATCVILNGIGKLTASSVLNSDRIYVESGILTAGGDIAGIGGGNTALTFLGAGIFNLGAYALTGSVDFGGHAGALNLGAGSSVSGSVDSTVTSSGTIEVFGNSTVLGAIGTTNQLDNILIHSGKSLTNHAVINVKNVTLEESCKIISPSLNITEKLTAGANSGITGDLNLKGAAVDLGSNVITVAGKVVTAGTITINTLVNGADNGCMHATEVDLSASTLEINIDSASVISAGTVTILDNVTADTETEVLINYSGEETSYKFSYAMGKLTIEELEVAGEVGHFAGDVS